MITAIADINFGESAGDELLVLEQVTFNRDTDVRYSPTLGDTLYPRQIVDRIDVIQIVGNFPPVLAAHEHFRRLFEMQGSIRLTQFSLSSPYTSARQCYIKSVQLTGSVIGHNNARPYRLQWRAELHVRGPASPPIRR